MNCIDSRQALETALETGNRRADLSNRVQAHLLGCSQCSDWYEESRRLDSLMLENTIEHEPGAFLWNRLAAQMHSGIPVPSSSGSRPWILDLTSSIWMGAFGRRQLIAGVSFLVILVSSLLMHQLVGQSQRDSMLSRFDQQWYDSGIAAEATNPFPLMELDTGRQTGDWENPFPVFEVTDADGNPFSIGEL